MHMRRRLKKDATAARLLRQLLTGDSTQAMESAKKMISIGARVDPAFLAAIASNSLLRQWSRIAAIYVLGFQIGAPGSDVLISILKNREESTQIRAHAAEALGNMQQNRACEGLRRILMSKESTALKKWSVYALSEIGSVRARSILREYAATKPTGVVAKELRLISPLLTDHKGRS
ncbi:MAG: HEAT repeat domain-containing protein [Candidatus Sulfotelmatobacter sp.]